MVDLSLVTRLSTDTFWVHRWTAEALALGADVGVRREALARAGRYRLARGNRETMLDDLVEAVRNLLDVERFDDASEWALTIVQGLTRNHQSADAAAFAAEVLRRLPVTHRTGLRWSTAKRRVSWHLALPYAHSIAITRCLPRSRTGSLK